MSISNINNSSSLWLQNLVALQRKGVERQGPSLQAELQHLRKSIKSGDLDAARSDYATITSRMPPAGPAPETELTAALGALGGALDSGDLDAAGEAMATVQVAMKNRPKGPPPPPPPDVQGAPPTGGATTDNEDRAELLLHRLQDAVQVSDLESAKSTYRMLETFLQARTDANPDGDSTATAAPRRIDLLA